MNLIHEIVQNALEAGNLVEMLNQLAGQLVNGLGAEGCVIGLWDADRKRLVPVSACGAVSAGLAFPLEVDRSPEKPPEGMTLVDLPLSIGERRLGALRLEFRDLNLPLPPDLGLAAALIGLAIDHRQAIEQEKKRRQESDLLQQATLAITSSLELEEVFSLILTKLEQVVPFESATICLIEGEHLRIAAQGGSAWHLRRVGDTIEMSAGLFSLLENAREPVYLADAQQHPSYERWSNSSEHDIHGWMGVPLIAYDDPIGYLLLNSRERDVYTPDAARLAQSFASQAAIALEKARLFEQVRSGRERMQALSKKLVEIQEDERRYIAHELHDEIGQELTGLQFILEMSKEGRKASRMEALGEGQRLVTGLMSKVRELSMNLHPSMIDDLGLLPALSAHFSRFQSKTGIRVWFETHNLERRFPAEVEVSAFRVVQEALTNVARYAGVKELEVQAAADEATLKIEVVDRGQGFDTVLLQDARRAFGIAGMRERTELAGGIFMLFSKPGQGTRITVVFPTGGMLERRRSDRKSPHSR